MVQLQTTRLRFFSWERDDIALATELWGNPSVMAYLDIRGGLSKEQVAERVQTERLCEARHGVQYWKVLSSSGDFIGCCGLRPWAFTIDYFSLPFELGFHLVPSARGKGFATEAALAVIDYAFGRLKLLRLFAGHHPENLRSQEILRKLGFESMGTVFYPPTQLHHPCCVLPNPGAQLFQWETEHLGVRAFRTEDADAFAVLVGDPRVMALVGDNRPLTREKAGTWISEAIRKQRAGQLSTMGVFERGRTSLIGFAGFTERRDSPREFEIIYGFHSKYWGKGLGFEVASGLVNLAFERFALPRVWATVDPQNHASIRILEKLSMSLVTERLDEFGLPERLYVLTRA